jgi:ligand-binding sensor domain-containing protein
MPGSALRPITAPVAAALLLGILAAAPSPAAPHAAARTAQSTPRIYLPLVGHYTRGELVAPLPAAGPTATATAMGSGIPTSTATRPGTPPPTTRPTTPRPTATRPSGGTAGEWSNFTLSRDVTALAFDAKANRLWAGTTSGLVAWDVQAHTSEKFTVAEGLLTNYITAVAVDAQNRVWVGHDLGVSVSEDGRDWQALREEDVVLDVAVTAIVGDADGGTWFGTAAGLVQRTPDGLFERVETPESVVDAPITSALGDTAGNLWFGTDGQGLAMRAAIGAWRTFTEADGLPDAGVFSLARDNTGRLWAGTGAGLARLEPDGTWTVVDKWRGDTGTKPIERVTALAVAASGDVWLAAEDIVLRLPAGMREAVDSSQERLAPAKAMAATPDGAVWFGLERALVRRAAGGERTDWLTADALPAAAVQAIAAGEDGRIWFGTANGVARSDPDGGWRQIVSSADGWGFSGTAVGADGHAWVVGGDGLIEVDPSGEQRLHHVDGQLPFTHIDAVSLDRNGRPWIGIGTSTTGPNVAWQEADGRWQSVELRSGLSGRRFPYIGSIAFDLEGALWVGSLSGLVRRAADGTLTAYSTRTGLFSDLVQCIEVDAAGRVWVGTLGDYNFSNLQWENGGLHMYDHGTWTKFTKADGLIANGDVYAVAFDDHGGTWIATKDGLSYRDGAGKWTSHTTADGLPAGGLVLDVAVDKGGDVWAVVPGTAELPDTHIGHLPKGGRWESLSIQIGPTDDNRIRSVTADPKGGVVFAGLNHAVWQAPDGARRAAFAGVDLVDVRAAAEDGAGNAYFGTPRGLVRRSAAGTWRTWTTYEGLPDGEIRSIEVDAAGSAWIGLTERESNGGAVTAGGGVARLDVAGTWTHWSMQNGVASNRVNDIALGAGGVLWAATEPETDGGTVGGGVSRRSADGTWSTLDEADGLDELFTTGIAAGDEGVIWVSSTDGVRRRDADATWTFFGSRDGLPSGEVAAIELDGAGDLWVGTSNGAGRLHPDGTIDTYGPAEGLGDVEVRSIGVGETAVWFGHLFHGVSRMMLR